MLAETVKLKKTGPDIIDQQSEHELIRRCQEGDISAFKEMYTIHSTMLYSIAMRWLGNKEDAEDAVQNCFIKIHKSIGQFKEQAKLSSYLVKILINSCYDILNRRKRMFSSEKPLTYDSQSDWTISLEKAITLLPIKMRECFILFAVEGFKQNEISNVLNITEGTVKAHIFQAKKKLRNILK